MTRKNMPCKPTSGAGDQGTIPAKPKQKQLGKTKGDLKRRARIIAAEIINGKSETEALKCAGYSHTSALNHKNEICNNVVIKQTFTQILESAGLTDSYIADRIKQLSEAKETKFFADKGIVTETREVSALGIQANMIEFAAKLKGHLVEKRETEIKGIEAILAELDAK